MADRLQQNFAFGDDFDQPIVGVQWSSGLQAIKFGQKFDQPIVGVQWPNTLQTKTFGQKFDQTIVGVPDGVKIVKPESNSSAFLSVRTS